MDIEAVDRFVAAVRCIDSDDRPGASTSVRRRPAVADALAAAVGLGLGDSANGLSEAALVDRLRALAHDVAVAAHYDLYPEDRPSRAEVAAVELGRADDALAQQPDVLVAAEALLRAAGAPEPSVAEVIAAARGLAATRGAA